MEALVSPAGHWTRSVKGHKPLTMEFVRVFIFQYRNAAATFIPSPLLKTRTAAK